MTMRIGNGGLVLHVVVTAVTVAACQPTHPVRRPVKDSSSGRVAIAIEGLEEQCGSCHDDNDQGLPQVKQMLSDVPTATLALQRISTGQMPPDGLPIDKRRPLIDTLCGVVTTSPARCSVAYSVGTPPMLMRPPNELIGDIKARWPFSDDVLGVFEGLRDTSRRSATYESPTGDALLVIGAMAGCTQAASKDKTVRVDDCLHSIISRDFVRAPEPSK